VIDEFVVDFVRLVRTDQSVTFPVEIYTTVKFVLYSIKELTDVFHKDEVIPNPKNPILLV
jgi:hypothetical protein